MVIAVHYRIGRQEFKAYFDDPDAQLPVRLRSGAVKLVDWGRREQELTSLPIGPYALIDDIHCGKWANWHPRPVKIPALRWLTGDAEGGYWNRVRPYHVIKGLLASCGQEQRVYIVGYSYKERKMGEVFIPLQVSLMRSKKRE